MSKLLWLFSAAVAGVILFGLLRWLEWTADPVAPSLNRESWEDCCG